MLQTSYFEGMDSVLAIACQVTDSMSLVALRECRVGLNVEVVTGNLYVRRAVARRMIESNDSHSQRASGEISPCHAKESTKCDP